MCLCADVRIRIWWSYGKEQVGMILSVVSPGENGSCQMFGKQGTGEKLRHPGIEQEAVWDIVP